VYYCVALSSADFFANVYLPVISGETGCGKTTQVPQFILDDLIR